MRTAAINGVGCRRAGPPGAAAAAELALTQESARIESVPMSVAPERNAMRRTWSVDRLCQGVVPLLAFALVALTCWRFGSRWTPDSANYVSMAQSLLDTGEVRDFSGNLVSGQPPLYPLLLAAAGLWSRNEVLAVVPWVNAALFASALAMFLHLARQVVAGVVWPWILAGAALLGFPLVLVALTAWSELLYVNLQLAFLLIAMRLVVDPRWVWVMALGVVAAAGTMTRYVGSTLVLAGSLVVFMCWGTTPGGSRPNAVPGPDAAVPARGCRPSRWAVALAFVIASSLPVVLWCWRNHLATGTVMGPRGASVFSWWQNCMYFSGTVLGWLLPSRCQGWPYYMEVAAAVTVSGLLAVAVKGTRRLLLDPGRPWVQMDSNRRRRILAMLITGGVYSAFLIVSASTTAFDRLDDRLLCPLYPLFLIGLALLPLRWGGSVLVFGLLMASSFAKSFDLVRIVATGWQDVPEAQWRRSELLMRLKAWPHGERLYSNVADYVYLVAGRQCHLMPFKYVGHNTNEATGALTAESVAAMRGSHVAYYHEGGGVYRSFLFTVQELQEVLRMDLVEEFRDGAIYRVAR